MSTGHTDHNEFIDTLNTDTYTHPGTTGNIPKSKINTYLNMGYADLLMYWMY